MRKLYIILLVLSVTNGGFAQWVPLNSGTSQILWSVFFTDSTTGYAVGNAGAILKTINGGTSWLAMNSGTSCELLSVYFPTADTGYVVGSSGTILKTTNAGVDWMSLVLGITGEDICLWSVYFTDANTGHVVGGCGGPSSSSGILKTTDGGSTWDIDWGINSNGLYSVFFTSPDTGYILGGYWWRRYWGMDIAKTTNGGSSYKMVYNNSMVWGSSNGSVYFSDPKTGYAVGANGIILRSSNIDSVWIPQISGTENDLHSVYLIPAAGGDVTAYAVGFLGTILKKLPGDTVWRSQKSGTLNYLSSVCFTDANTGYVVGDSGTILKTSNGGGIGIGEIQGYHGQLYIFPNPSSEWVTIESTDPLKSFILTIYTLTGRQILNKKSMQNKTKFDLSDLPSGVYIVKLTGDKKVLIGKIIKE